MRVVEKVKGNAWYGKNLKGKNLYPFLWVQDQFTNIRRRKEDQLRWREAVQFSAKYLLKPQSLTTSNQVLLTEHLGSLQNSAKTESGLKPSKYCSGKIQNTLHEWPAAHLLDLEGRQITSKPKEPERKEWHSRETETNKSRLFTWISGFSNIVTFPGCQIQRKD